MPILALEFLLAGFYILNTTVCIYTYTCKYALAQCEQAYAQENHARVCFGQFKCAIKPITSLIPCLGFAKWLKPSTELTVTSPK